MDQLIVMEQFKRIDLAQREHAQRLELVEAYVKEEVAKSQAEIQKNKEWTTAILTGIIEKVDSLPSRKELAKLLEDQKTCEDTMTKMTGRLDSMNKVTDRLEALEDSLGENNKKTEVIIKSLEETKSDMLRTFKKTLNEKTSRMCRIEEEAKNLDLCIKVMTVRLERKIDSLVSSVSKIREEIRELKENNNNRISASVPNTGIPQSCNTNQLEDVTGNSTNESSDSESSDHTDSIKSLDEAKSSDSSQDKPTDVNHPALNADTTKGDYQKNITENDTTAKLVELPPSASKSNSTLVKANDCSEPGAKSKSPNRVSDQAKESSPKKSSGAIPKGFLPTSPRRRSQSSRSGSDSTSTPPPSFSDNKKSDKSKSKSTLVKVVPPKGKKVEEIKGGGKQQIAPGNKLTSGSNISNISSLQGSDISFLQASNISSSQGAKVGSSVPAVSSPPPPAKVYPPYSQMMHPAVLQGAVQHLLNIGVAAAQQQNQQIRSPYLPYAPQPQVGYMMPGTTPPSGAGSTHPPPVAFYPPLFSFPPVHIAPPVFMPGMGQPIFSGYSGYNSGQPGSFQDIQPGFIEELSENDVFIARTNPSFKDPGSEDTMLVESIKVQIPLFYLDKKKKLVPTNVTDTRVDKDVSTITINVSSQYMKMLNEQFKNMNHHCMIGYTMKTEMVTVSLTGTINQIRQGYLALHSAIVEEFNKLD